MRCVVWYTCTTLQHIIFQKAIISIVTAVRTSNLASLYNVALFLLWALTCLCYQAGDGHPHLYNPLKKTEFVDYGRLSPDPSSAQVYIYMYVYSHTHTHTHTHMRAHAHHACTQGYTEIKDTKFLWTFNWEVSDHPAHIPDLIASEFHLFLHLKKHLVARSFTETKRWKPP